MSKYSIKELWNERYGNQEQVRDYAGRIMLKSACGNPYSAYHPTIDHIRPISCGGKDVKENIQICHSKTNEEKGDLFPHWKTNGNRCHAVRKKGGKNGYKIVVDN